MGIDITALTTNADKLGECIDKNKKQEQDRKDEQLYGIIERKVKKEEHKREKPRGQDGTLKKCKRLFEKDASPEVLTKLEESLREQEKYYRYYVQCFLPVLDKAIERSKKISNETKKQVISKITDNSRYCFTHNRRDSETESGYGSDVGDDHEVNGTTDNDALLLKAIKNGNNRKFRKYLKDCTDISSIKDEKGNNILHFIASLEKKQKCKFLGTLIKTVTKEDLAQLINSENQTPFQVALINKVTKEKHESNTIRSNDNTLKFLTKLLEHGASSDNLELSTEELQNLKEEQKTYYRNFLEKLAEQGKKSKLKPEIRINTEAKIKEIIPHTINTPDSNDNYLLHPVIKNSDKKLFKELLEKGADISLKDTDGNNALHLIVKPETKQKLKLLNILLETGQKEQFIKAVNDKKEGQTPLHQILQRIQEKSENRSLKKFEKTKRYETLELLLKNGADITVQDKDEKNALHHIALLKGEQKVTCLELILNSVEKEKFSKAANATNEKERTPLQVALITKTTKDKHNLVNPKSRDNTIKFCVKLLQNGVDPKQLILPERLWSKEYYKTIKGIEKSMGRALIPDDMRTELKCNFGRKLKARDIVKYINNVACKAVTTLVFAALACAAIFSASQGIITIATASSIIAVIGVCYLIYLNLENIYEGFGKIKGKFTEEKQLTLQDNAPKNDTQCNNSVKDIENKSNDLEEQEVQKSPNQSEHTESPPDTKMSAISIYELVEKLCRDSVTSKPSSLAL
ncbi:MAG: ankyrin repeat domain-containing protein [Wolbachia endosymbiont of Andrena praecox]|uniref:ankyrin repeat domain-containing protein n=1 Tax=Wolbachia TaxID=953 RepID=UPI0015FC4DAD|nr:MULTISPECIES: ankyrin repeat domain-containing protein [Wolbachia]MDX5488139.1 ankyrin repeat domain-containing protein [Wolbachia endosymbiont of Andrena praecox]MDX5497888.1 ankyrin repeat domain-containing protein [Wolbachia endosymbiont of Lasioglossum nitidulum]MDX5510292.1 ankyrin repeat domain-containing protein [Wolbachia endosymbiont of Lasioglossum morio]MDX5543500.1 ankyrin repeat domain-containing protein [Wolbachia endosymbiont of Andrena apicata]MDX5562205.1 ankyrin repeat dom